MHTGLQRRASAVCPGAPTPTGVKCAHEKTQVEVEEGGAGERARRPTPHPYRAPGGDRARASRRASSAHARMCKGVVVVAVVGRG
eukprot:scaffold3796_cov188-Prasinococcus_capsulatus_cf.AAC.1